MGAASPRNLHLIRQLQEALKISQVALCQASTCYLIHWILHTHRKTHYHYLQTLLFRLQTLCTKQPNNVQEMDNEVKIS